MSVPVFERPVHVTPFGALIDQIDALPGYVVVNDLGNRVGSDHFNTSDRRHKIYVVEGEYRLQASLVDLLLRRGRGRLALIITPDAREPRHFSFESYGHEAHVLATDLVSSLIANLRQAGIFGRYNITLRKVGDEMPSARRIGDV